MEGLMDWIDEYLNELFEPIEDWSKKTWKLYELLETSTLAPELKDDYEYHIGEVSNQDEFRECFVYLLQYQESDPCRMTVSEFNNWMRRFNPKPE